MAKRYILTPRADFRLAEISVYSAKKWGIAQAEKYLRKLHTTMQKLADGNVKGKDCEALIGIKGTELYYYHEGRHYIFYQPHPDGIEVLTLYHDRMNLADHLQTLV